MAPTKRRKSRGISSKQARFLAQLQRRAGEHYTGNGLSMQQASDEIERVLRILSDREGRRRAGRSLVDASRAALIVQAPKKKERQRARRERAEAIAAAAPPPRAGRERPTPIQLHDLAVLARRAGEAMPQPPNRGDAARELVRLRSALP